MNYEVLLLLCLVYILPLAIIYRRFVKENERIDAEYRKYRKIDSSR